MAQPQELNQGNSAAILDAISRADFSGCNPSDSKTHVAANKIFEANSFNQGDFFNLIVGRAFDAGMEEYLDVEADGITAEHIAEASALLFRVLSTHYGSDGAKMIISRIPLRVYMNGMHSASSKRTKICNYDPAKFGTEQEMADRLKAAGVSEAEANELAQRMTTSIPYECFTRVVNSLSGKISKRMIIRIIVMKVKAIHANNGNGAVKNSFIASLTKYGLDVDEDQLAHEWQFFGADLHPAFPLAQKKAYLEVRKAVFEAASEGKGALTPFQDL